MRLLKSVFAVAAAFAVVMCMGVCALADSTDTYSTDTYSIDIPEGFTKSETDGITIWKNSTSDIVIELTVAENAGSVKVNPNQMEESHIASAADALESSIKEVEGMTRELISKQAALMELGEHDAIRACVAEKYSLDGREFTVYRICYLFETLNYSHSFVVTGDEDISQFADDLIKTLKINDEAIALREGEAEKGGLLKGVLLGALVGAVVGGVVALAKKITSKSDVEDYEGIVLDDDDDEPECQDSTVAEAEEEDTDTQDEKLTIE